MNWRRGLWRLWLVFSLCWIVAVGVAAWREEAWIGTRISACAEAKGAQGANPFSCFDRDELARLKSAPVGLADVAAVIKDYAAFAFLPPLIALVLGLLGVWVASGFARKSAREK